MLAVGDLLTCVDVIICIAAFLLQKKFSDAENNLSLQRQVLNYSGNLLFCQLPWYFQKSLHKSVSKKTSKISFSTTHDNTIQ